LQSPENRFFFEWDETVESVGGLACMLKSSILQKQRVYPWAALFVWEVDEKVF